MKKLIVLLVPLLLFLGCGPRKLTPAEIAAQRAKESAKQAQQKEREAEQKIKDAAKAAEAKQRKIARSARARVLAVIAHNKEELAKDPLPPGVHQVGSLVFLADPGKTAGLRHVCTGRYDDGSGTTGNDVNEAQMLNNGGVQVKCKGSVEHFRDETWQDRYLYDKAHGIGMPGVMFANPALQKKTAKRKVGGKT